VRLESGTLAALFPLLPGEAIDRANPDHLRAFGEAVADLRRALAALDVGPPPPGLPSYGHPITPDVPHPWEIAAQPPLTTLLSAVDRDHLARVVRALYDAVPRCYDPLPIQLCHNDCGPRNALAIDGRVSAFLDIEFAGPDRRAVDIAGAWYWSVGPAWGSGGERPIIRAVLDGNTARGCWTLAGTLSVRGEYRRTGTR
jgi:Ser/Thr protein kinase RdoA (MazF antagonist)